MGLYKSKLFSPFISFREHTLPRILMLGLDATGKTTILSKLKLDEDFTITPTTSFNLVTVQLSEGVSFTLWDIGGREQHNSLVWRHYYPDTQGLVYVVDSSDRLRISTAKEVLSSILNEKVLEGVPLIIIANKQDLPGALSPSDLISELSLGDFTDRKWHVQGTCAVTGEGVIESMEKLWILVKEYMQNRDRT